MAKIWPTVAENVALWFPRWGIMIDERPIKVTDGLMGPQPDEAAFYDLSKHLDKIVHPYVGRLRNDSLFDTRRSPTATELVTAESERTAAQSHSRKRSSVSSAPHPHINVVHAALCPISSIPHPPCAESLALWCARVDDEYQRLFPKGEGRPTSLRTTVVIKRPTYDDEGLYVDEELLA
jgi:hypothetical protein